MTLGEHPASWVRTPIAPMGVLCCTASPWLYKHTQSTLGVWGKKGEQLTRTGEVPR